MAYDHARKAGNKGDVWKHFTLVTVVHRLDVTGGLRKPPRASQPSR
jgi:23S rRNA A2030 N6-methylase RlmJ